MKCKSFIPRFERIEERVVPATLTIPRANPKVAIRSAVSIRAADFAAVPLDELTGTYEGYAGGLYGDGQNEPPEILAVAAAAAANSIRPLSARGLPSSNGRIGVLSIGQSTTRIVFDAFSSRAKTVKAKNVTLINGASDGKTAEDWANRSGPWNNAMRQIRRTGTDARQIQVVWIETALILPARFGTFPRHNMVYSRLLTQIVNRSARQFPNLKLIFISSRYYGGWTQRMTSPEPFAYESAFGVRDTIVSAIPNSQESAGAIPPRPVVLWGPYYWTSGTRPSRIDGLTLDRTDLRSDGVHTTVSGSAKFADQLLRFFTEDRFAKDWFTGTSG